MNLPSSVWEKATRGCAEIISEEELKAKLLKDRPLRIKLGVDPTAPDLHLGHMVVLRKLRAFQDLGHRVEFIIGDFTARIGDPSGRSETRPMLKAQEIWEHAKTYQDQVFRVLDKTKTEVRFNSTWLNALGIPGLLELTRRATVAQMLKRADFKERFEAGTDVTLLEFLYPLMHGYDSVAVQADVELGGTDQKFNLLMGREIQRDYKQEAQVVMTMPLLEGLDGTRKMSKSYGNYVAFMDSAKEQFGKLMSIPDALIAKYAELLTELEVASVQAMHPREAKERVAKDIVGHFHGPEAAEAAAAEFRRVFSNKEAPEEVPEHCVSSSPVSAVELLVAAGLAPSKAEARRLLVQGAVTIEGKKIGENDSIAVDAPILIQVGKRRFARLLPP